MFCQLNKKKRILPIDTTIKSQGSKTKNYYCVSSMLSRSSRKFVLSEIQFIHCLFTIFNYFNFLRIKAVAVFY